MVRGRKIRTQTYGEGEVIGGESEDTIAGANHMDPMFISADTAGYRTNPVIEPLLDFVETNRTE
ncbi:MAG: hypothetical protein ACLFPD_12020 [Desulfosudaceae bacterium]